jgi:hypothetical protein
MALSLKEIQLKLQAQQEKKDRAKNGQFTGENGIYPFWNNPLNTTAVIRFLPDGDDTNDFFWRERLIVNLIFPGIKGQSETKPVTVKVPCMDMWKPNTCPIMAEIKPWWKDPDLESLARKYWRKKDYLFQGFVVQNPNPQDKTPENPIRKLNITTTIFDLIKGILLNNDVDYLPTDYEHGRDFNLAKTTKGDFANYTTSTWSMRERALNAAELEALDKFSLFNLNSLLPKKPDDKALEAIIELFHASVNEELYDTDRWGQFFKPSGFRSNNDSDTVDDSSVQAAAKPVAAPITAASIMNKITKPIAKPVVEDSPPWEDDSSKSTATVVTGESKPKMQTPDDILAAIRRRQSK